jgi:hypothetical protein
LHHGSEGREELATIDPDFAVHPILSEEEKY